MNQILDPVISAFGFDPEMVSYSPFGNGLINHTWKLAEGKKEFILQRINTEVFKDPGAIADNIRLIGNYLEEQQPDYFFVQPLDSLEGYGVVVTTEGTYRIFPFVKGSHTIDVVTEPEQAYEAARQFAKFTRVLSGLDANQLTITLRGFHDLGFRFRQFQQAIQNGNQLRVQGSKALIDLLMERKNIVTRFEAIRFDPAFKTRVTHHDTKISNVLFDQNDKGICVIDLDTCMPGYFISDVGDMMRTYLSPVSEEEKDLSRIMVREDFFYAILEGYNSEMEEELTQKEKQHFLYSGEFMIYMQAIRFLTDHLNNDSYYGSKYEGHNLIRAQNQFTLLQRLQEFNSR